MTILQCLFCGFIVFVCKPQSISACEAIDTTISVDQLAHKKMDYGVKSNSWLYVMQKNNNNWLF